MKVKYRLIIILILTLVIWKTVYNFYFHVHKTEEKENSAASAAIEDGQGQGQEQEQEEDELLEKVKISVYYEALCSDSRYFILKQLVPAYETMPDYIDIDLVPYGKAETYEQNDQITFKCQHAALECLANKIHACGIHYITDPYLQLKYIACMINDNMIPNAAGEKCAEELGIDYGPIGKCAEEFEGSLLLKEYGMRTHALNPPATFIPTIELNGSQKIPLTLILKNLLKELCNLLTVKPSQCM